MLIREICNFLAPILLRFRWKRIGLSLFQEEHEQKKLLSLIPRLIQPKSDNKKKKILIGSIRSLAFSNLFEGGIGATLKKAGFDVSVLRCGQFLDVCETKTYFKDNQIACSMCHREFDYFKKIFDLDDIYYREILTLSMKNEIINFINSIKLIDFHSWKGYSLEKEWNSALKRYYLGTDSKVIEKPETAKKFLFTTIASFEIGRQLVKNHGYTHLFTSHGIYSTWGGLVKGFKEAGGDVTVWGRGYYKSGVISMKGESYLNGLSFYGRDYIEQNVDKEYLEEAKNYLDSKWNLAQISDLRDYYKGVDKGEEGNINLSEGIKYVGFFPNVPWDGQVFVSTDKINGIRDVLEYILRFIHEHEDVHFIIRPHPWENPEVNPKIQETFMDIAEEYDLGNLDEITIIPYGSNITSYDIAERIKVAVLLAGTLGIELAVKGIDVIQLGRSVSSNKGLFYEPQSYQEFSQKLEVLLYSNHLPNEEKMKSALDWATLFYCQAHMENPFFIYKGAYMDGVKNTLDSNQLTDYLAWVLNGDGFYHV